MANQQNQQNQQGQQGQQNQQRANTEQNRADKNIPDPNGEVSRSEDLLPAGAADNTADGRFEVAEEVSLDQQSDATRRVGKAPEGIASDALADSLKPDANRDDSGT
jgi:transcription initiation factor TFIID subunit TAF12